MSLDTTQQEGFDCKSVTIAAGDSEPIGERVKRLREAHGLSQNRLATTLGIPQGYISGWESGTRVLRGAFLTRLAEGLGVNSQYLATGRGDPCPNSIDEEIALIVEEARCKIASRMGVNPDRLTLDLRYR